MRPRRPRARARKKTVKKIMLNDGDGVLFGDGEPGPSLEACLEAILLVLDLARGQQPRRLEVEQGGRHHQEVARLVQVERVGPGPDVADELVGDLGQGDLGDVQLVLGDQPEEQIERPLEDVEVDLEARRVAGLARAARLAVHRRDHGVPAGACPGPGSPAASRSRRASRLDSTPASRSASSTAMASRTIRPRSTLSPRARRVIRARSRSSSSPADR